MMRVEGRAEFPHRHVALCRSCTSTTLSLFDWLKLEDISISLFFVTVSRRNKKRHRLGQRQPRYMKFFQVCPGNDCYCKRCFHWGLLKDLLEQLVPADCMLPISILSRPQLAFRKDGCFSWNSCQGQMPGTMRRAPYCSWACCFCFGCPC